MGLSGTPAEDRRVFTRSTEASVEAFEESTPIDDLLRRSLVA
jgi:hypothetical protein